MDGDAGEIFPIHRAPDVAHAKARHSYPLAGAGAARWRRLERAARRRQGAR